LVSAANEEGAAVPKPFRGVINLDIRESVPDWEPYTEPMAPEGAPNVLYIVLDDVGFSAIEPWGGLIESPNIVTGDYPGSAPYAFSGGTITEAIVDVSGDQYLDVELEALAMMKRE
jgi:hypothetical protein